MLFLAIDNVVYLRYHEWTTDSMTVEKAIGLQGAMILWPLALMQMEVKKTRKMKVITKPR